MRRTGLLFIILGLLLAVLSGVGVFRLLQQQAAPAPTPVPAARIVVAAQDIPDRTAVQASMLTLKDWPQDMVPVGATTESQDLIGKITSGRIVAGEPVLLSKVSSETATSGLAPTLPPGLVAMVLSLSPVAAVGGAVRTGDSVDILLSLDYGVYNEQGDESKDLHTTFYSIQDVPILEALIPASAKTETGTLGATSQASMGSAVVVTILVTPQDALLLKYAREKGTIDLVLRSPQFHDQVVTDPVYLEYIMRRFELPEPLIIIKKAAQATTGEDK